MISRDDKFKVKEILDTIDAEVFVGDTFLDETMLKVLDFYVSRWSRAVKDNKKLIKEMESDDQNT